jgi:integrase
MYKLIFEILFWTGCRCGELLGIFLEDLDFRNNTININKTFYRRNKQDYLTSPKTESSNRKVTVPEFLMKELKVYTDSIYGIKQKDRIFEITDRAIQKKLKSKIEALGLIPIRIHDIRHSSIAFLIEKNVQPLAIAQRVGHDSVNTTMNIYGHLYPNKQKQIADMLNSEATGEPPSKVISFGQNYGNRKAGGMW